MQTPYAHPTPPLPRQAILAVMKTHPNNDAVLKNSCRALANLAYFKYACLALAKYDEDSKEKKLRPHYTVRIAPYIIPPKHHILTTTSPLHRQDWDLQRKGNWVASVAAAGGIAVRVATLT